MTWISVSVTITLTYGKRDSPVSIAAGYGLNSIFLFFVKSKPALRPIILPIQWVPGIKRLRREADHSLPSSTEVKDGTAIHPLPYIYVLMAWCLIKNRDNFTFIVTIIMPRNE
jgi:hypothetical protein